MIHSENCHDDLIDLVLKYFLNETLTPSQYAPTPEHGLSHCHICGLVSMLEERSNAFQLTGNRETKIKIFTNCGFRCMILTKGHNTK